MKKSIHIFKVKTDKDAEEREMRVDKPTGLYDLGAWQDRIQAADDAELEAKIFDLAWGNWVIKWQDAYRRKRSTDPNDWKYGAPVVRTFAKPKVTEEGLAEHGAEPLTEAQLDYIASIGVDTSALTTITVDSSIMDAAHGEEYYDQDKDDA